MNISGYRNSRSCASGFRYGYSQKMATNLFFHAISLTHSAYPFWSGALFNRGRTKPIRWTSTCPTAIWPPACCRRRAVPPDSHGGRCGARRLYLFDLDQLRMEYSPDEYQNLRCVSSWTISRLCSHSASCRRHGGQLGSLDRLSCTGPAPVCWREVWIGYDPAKGTQNGDSADAWWWRRQPCRAVSSAFLSSPVARNGLPRPG